MKNSNSFMLCVAIIMGLVGCGGGDSKPQVVEQNNTVQTKEFNLSIIHLNDIHSHLAGEDFTLKFDGVDTVVKLGGYPRVVGKIKELQSTKKNTLTLYAGDAFQGTLYYSLFKSKADSDMLNLIKWDAFELGNHEFDDGDGALGRFLGDFKGIDVLASNVVPKSGNVLAGKWKNYIVKDFNGEKVGVIGILVAQKTKVSSNPSEDIEFLDEISTAQKYIDKLKAEDIDKIILLTHQGYEADKVMASKLRGVDIIIGGDSHTLLGDFRSVGLDNPKGYDYPTHTTNKDGNKVCIAQAWHYAYSVGNMDVDFDKDGVVKNCGGDAILLLGDVFWQNNREVNETTKTTINQIIAQAPNLAIVKEEGEAKAKLDGYSSKVEEHKATVIGASSRFLGHNRLPGDMIDGKSNLPLGSNVAPIVAHAFYELSNRADASIQNGGGVRGAIEEGNITMDTAYALLPFANTLYEIEMKGGEVKQVLEDALSNYLDHNGSTGSFPYAYGLRYDIDTNATANSRISNLEIKARATGVWSPIDDEALYIIVTNNYLASGKDGYLTFKSVQGRRGKGVDTYLDYAMSFVRYIEAKEANGEKLTKLPTADHPIKSYNGYTLGVAK